jgi:serine/threonine protein kinase/tetratricopeptide (TPR) repeat protein
MEDLGIIEPESTGRVRPDAAANTPDSEHSLEEAAHAFRDLLRLNDGASIDSWCESYHGDNEHAQLFRELHQSDPGAATRLAEGLVGLPAVGDTFLGFRLEQELGRGAFGRVYLARQPDLANRLVALKVSAGPGAESQTLARLQHTHIVPIYSCHRAGSLQAVCMPYFGATTLVDVLRDLNTRHRLPDSGRELLSTVYDKQSKTLAAADGSSTTSSRSAVEPEAPAATPALPPLRESTVTLRMLEGMSYVDAVLWIGARLADGLAHAHERGILHRDLKPANVLLTDEGQPMLLDFNLSEDAARAQAPAAHIGGTLPYMAPEHLAALNGGKRPVDARSDLFALGLILYELLTARHPFGRYRGPSMAVLPYMINDRRQPPPLVRPWNDAVSPAAEAIVRRCLEPDPARRYQSASELRDDLERQLANQPLRHAREPSMQERLAKWWRRHPRLGPFTVAVSAVGLLVVTAALLVARDRELARRQDELAHHQAVETRGQFRHDWQTAQLLLNGRLADRAQRAQGRALALQALARYQVLDNQAWADLQAVRRLPADEQARLREDVGTLLLLLAGSSDDAAAKPQQQTLEEALRLNRLAERSYLAGQAPGTLWTQRAQLVAALGQPEEAQRLLDRAKEVPAGNVTDAVLAARELVQRGQWLTALPMLRDAVRKDPQNFAAWYLLGNCYLDGLAREAEASACYTTCIALWPDFYGSYFNRGLAELRRRDHDAARQDFSRALELRSDFAEGHVHRALAFQGLRKYGEAETDLSRALELGAAGSRVHLLRSQVRTLRGDKAGALKDLQEGLRQQPADEEGWLTRGYVRADSEPHAALEDFARAVQCNPRSLAGLQNQAHVLAEKLGNNAAAIGKLDALLGFYPDYAPALAGRGVLRARLGRREAAQQDARAALLRDTRAPMLYQVAGVYALSARDHPEDRREALRLLREALQQGFGLDVIDNDPDLAPLRADPQFQDLLKGAKALQARLPVNR